MFLFCCHFWALVIRLDFCCVNQIELQEQRSSGRGNKSKDSKRKRKSQKTEGGPKSTEASECKKTKPVSLTPPSDPHTGTHSKLNWSHALFMRTVREQTDLLFSCRSCDVFLKLWRGRWRLRGEPQRQKNAGLGLISPHNKLTLILLFNPSNGRSPPY